MKGQAALTILMLFYFTRALSVQTDTLEGKTVVDAVDTNGYTQIGGKYYLIVYEQKLNWFAAAHYCREKSLDLATIENQNEMLALSSHLVSKGYSKDDWFWLSGNDLGEEGKFKWLSTGLPMLYTKWSANQPDNWQGNENCVHLWRFDDQFFMNDRACDANLAFICEVPLPKKVSFTVW